MTFLRRFSDSVAAVWLIVAISSISLAWMDFRHGTAVRFTLDLVMIAIALWAIVSNWPTAGRSKYSRS